MIGIGLRAREPYLPSPGGCAFVRRERAVKAAHLGALGFRYGLTSRAGELRSAAGRMMGHEAADLGALGVQSVYGQ